MRISDWSSDVCSSDLLIEAVDDARALCAADACQLRPAVGEKGVHLGSIRIAGGGMDDQAGGLVEHDEIAVLVKDVQRDRLAFQGDRSSFGEDAGERLFGLHLGGGAENRSAAERSE